MYFFNFFQNSSTPAIILFCPTPFVCENEWWQQCSLKYINAAILHRTYLKPTSPSDIGSPGRLSCLPANRTRQSLGGHWGSKVLLVIRIIVLWLLRIQFILKKGQYSWYWLFKSLMLLLLPASSPCGVMVLTPRPPAGWWVQTSSSLSSSDFWSSSWCWRRGITGEPAPSWSNAWQCPLLLHTCIQQVAIIIIITVVVVFVVVIFVIIIIIITLSQTCLYLPFGPSIPRSILLGGFSSFPLPILVFVRTHCCRWWWWWWGSTKSARAAKITRMGICSSKRCQMS